MTSTTAASREALVGNIRVRPAVARPRAIVDHVMAEGARRVLARRLRLRLTETAAEMTDEIRRSVPEYRGPHDPAQECMLQQSVRQALLRFVDRLEHGRDIDDSWHEVYEKIGAGEMHAGRSLDALQAAIRVASRVAWRQLIKVTEDGELPVSALGPLAEAIFSYLDELVGVSATGYANAQAAEAGEMDRRRRRLVQLLVADPPASAEAIAAAAEAAQWRLPRQVAVVAVAPLPANAGHPVLAPDLLADFDQAQPFLIVPDPRSPARVRALINGLARHGAAVGPRVAPEHAAKSLRWARRAWDLTRRGVIPAEDIVWCSDHLATLAVFQDDDLLDTLMERRLAPLATLREVQREALTDTLLAWLQLNMNANEVAARLHVHPQTVRHRLRQITRLFGDQMRDPDLRFELEIALRAEHARRTSRPAGPGR